MNANHTRKSKKLFALSLIFIFFMVFPSKPLNDIDLNPTRIRNSAADKTLNITIYDLDNQLIPNAEVEISNGGEMYTQTSDEYGNVSFTLIDNDTWDIHVRYSLGDKLVEYLVYDSSYVMNVAPGGLASHSVVVNLTTISLEIGDSSISDHNKWGLFNANITLVNSTNGNNITSYYSDTNGNVDLILPATDYNLTINYQDIDRQFFLFYIGGPQIYRNTQNITVSEAESYDVYVDVAEFKTKLSLENVSFSESWAHEVQMFEPYSIDKVYYSDVISFIFEWNKTEESENVGIVKPTSGIWNTWTITRGGSTINSSLQSPDALAAITGQTGNYSFVLDTSDYFAGEYVFTLMCNKSGYQDAYLNLNFEIYNYSSQLDTLKPADLVPTDKNVQVYWNETFFLEVNYTSILPEIANISGAVLNYALDEDVTFSGVLNAPVDGTGIYNLSGRIENLPPSDPSYYTLRIWGNETNFAYVSIEVRITVYALPTDIYFEITDEFKLGPTLMKVAHGENILFRVNYSDGSGTPLQGATLNIYLDEILQSSSYVTEISDGYWEVDFSADPLTNTTHQVRAEVEKENYETQNALLNIIKNDYWETEISLSQGFQEKFYWGHNVSFIIDYHCTEDPRDEQSIENGIISELNISTRSAGSDLLQLRLTSADISSGKWNWSEIGEGKYSIWFNSSNLNISSTTQFFIKPLIQYSVYEAATSENIYFNLNLLPIEINSYDINDLANPLVYFNLDQDNSDEMVFVSQIRVDQSSSGLDGTLVQDLGLEIRYEILNKTDSSIINASQLVLNDNGGQYQFSIVSNNYNVGEYQFRINVTGENYTYAIDSFSFNITKSIGLQAFIPADFQISASSIKAAIGENFTVYLNVSDNVGLTWNAYVNGNFSNPYDWIQIYSGPEYDYYIEQNTSIDPFSIGTFVLTIRATQGLWNYEEKNLSLNVIDGWTASADLDVQAIESAVRWNQNTSFVVSYYCNDPIRENLPLADANITLFQLYVGTSIEGGIDDVDFSSSDASHPMWGWNSLEGVDGYNPGDYLVWFNTSIFAVVEDINIMVLINIEQDYYKLARSYFPTTLQTIDTDMIYTVPGVGNNINLLSLSDIENASLLINYFIDDIISPDDGMGLNDSTITVTIRYDANSTVLSNISYLPNDMIHQDVFYSNGTLDFSIDYYANGTIISKHEYNTDGTSIYEEYFANQTVSYREVYDSDDHLISKYYHEGTQVRYEEFYLSTELDFRVFDYKNATFEYFQYLSSGLADAYMIEWDNSTDYVEYYQYPLGTEDWFAFYYPNGTVWYREFYENGSVAIDAIDFGNGTVDYYEYIYSNMTLSSHIWRLSTDGVATVLFGANTSLNVPLAQSNYQNKNTTLQANYAAETGYYSLVLDPSWYSKVNRLTTVNGTWNFSIIGSDFVPNEYVVEINCSYLNYTQQIDEFSFIIGQSDSSFTYSIGSQLRINDNYAKVALGENFTLLVEIDGLGSDEGWVKIFFDDYEIPSQYIYRLSPTGGLFNVSVPISVLQANMVDFTLDSEYDVLIRVNQMGLLPAEHSIVTKIITSWKTEFSIVKPPLLYPWGNIVSFNATYYCTEAPRDGDLLSGADVSEIEILLILEDELQSILNLSISDLGVIWGFEEYKPGFYYIWFNSTYINLDQQKSYYIIPEIGYDVYAEATAKPKPPFVLAPVGTNLIMAQNSNLPIGDIENIIVFLDDPLVLNFSFYIEDSLSIMNLDGIEGSTVSFEIYDRVNDRLFASGYITGGIDGIFIWDVPTITIGNYSVVVTAMKANHETSVVQFSLNVSRYLISHSLAFENENSITHTPSNVGLVLNITTNDYRTEQALVGGSLTASFNGQTIICNESSTVPGLYQLTLTPEMFDGLKTGDVLTITFEFSMTNYTTISFNVFVKMDLDVDPYFGVPYAYWAVIGIVGGVFVSALVARKMIKTALIPTVIKRIDLLQKIIQKGKVAPDKRLALNPVEEMYKKFKNDWQLLDLSMKSALDITEFSGLDDELNELLESEDNPSNDQENDEGTDDSEPNSESDVSSYENLTESDLPNSEEN